MAVNYNPHSWDGYKGKHVIITGGSSGIGKECARILLNKGAYVTVISRSMENLENTKDELSANDQDNENNVLIKSADVTDHDEIESAILEAINHFDVGCHAIICSAGTSIPKKFDDLDIEDFHSQMKVNYFGTVNSIKAILPSMKQQHDGRIILVSSQVAQTGMFGYTAYSPTKFALRGLAESLYPEVRPYGIHVSVSYPPDTKTPGYENEMKMKPIETKEMSESGDVWEAKDIAKDITNTFKRYKFTISHGFDGYILNTLSGGCEPSSGFFSTLLKCVSFPFLRFVWTCYYLPLWYKIALKHYNNNDINIVYDENDPLLKNH